jgi:flagellar assembly protein FliH
MMHLSKVISGELSDESALPFHPPVITEDDSSSFVSDQINDDVNGSSSAFVLDKIQEEIAGLDKTQRNKINNLVQQEVLHRLQEIQEEAYSKGFELGRIEGRDQAMRDANQQIEQSIQSISELIYNLQHQYHELAKKNEARIIDLIFKIASRIATKTLEIDRQAMIEVVRQTVSNISNNEQIILEIHPSLVQFFEELQSKSEREFEFLKNSKIQPNESISIGGCLVRAEFGQIDAQLETRLNNLWKNLSLVMPRVS